MIKIRVKINILKNVVAILICTFIFLYIPENTNAQCFGSSMNYFSSLYQGYTRGTSGHSYSDWYNNWDDSSTYKPDCSGLTNSTMWSAGYSSFANHTVSDYINDTTYFDNVSTPQIGDFWIYGNSSHMGVVTAVNGNIMTIRHSSSSQGKIVEWTNINYVTDSYWGTNNGGRGKRVK
jgi:hypothetical protein